MPTSRHPAQDVKIDVEDDVLTISGQHDESRQADDKNYLRRERVCGAFSRSVSLPKGVDPKQITATTHDGAVEVTIPLPQAAKKEKLRSRRVQDDPPRMTGLVLFCFDGSDGSLRALSDGGALLVRRAAVVLTVWETITTQLAYSGGFGFGYVRDEGELDAQEEVAAWQAAERGVLTAEGHGWQATGRVENAPVAVWRTVVMVADEIDASLIVCGARGRNAAKRALLGSVAEAVLHHSHRPTLIALQPPNED